MHLYGSSRFCNFWPSGQNLVFKKKIQGGAKLNMVGQYGTLSDLPLNCNAQLKKMSIYWGLTKPNIMPKNCKNL